MRSARAAALALGLLFAAAPWPVSAEAGASTLVRMSGRIFDLRVDATTLSRSWNSLLMNQIDWLAPILAADPDLGGAVFLVHSLDAESEGLEAGGARVTNAPAADMWAVPGPGRLFRHATGIPDRFDLPGYEAWGNHPDAPSDILLLPTYGPADFSVTCDTGRWGPLLLCTVRAAYPPDPLIFLEARIFRPEPFDEVWPRFRAAAERMRQIVRCLDVTEEVARAGAPGPKRAAEGLAGCATDRMS